MYIPIGFKRNPNLTKTIHATVYGTEKSANTVTDKKSSKSNIPPVEIRIAEAINKGKGLRKSTKARARKGSRKYRKQTRKRH